MVFTDLEKDHVDHMIRHLRQERLRIPQIQETIV